MKKKLLIKYFAPVLLSGLLLVSVIGCTDKLDQPFENESFNSDVDYTISENMVFP